MEKYLFTYKNKEEKYDSEVLESTNMLYALQAFIDNYNYLELYSCVKC